MKKFLAKIQKILQRQISNDFQRKREELIILLFALGTISFGMTILNIATHKTDLLAATAIFAVFSYASALVGWLDKKSMKWSTALFIIEFASLFTYFIIYGGTEGFSTIWLLLLPSCGLFAFDKKRGSIMTGGLFIELIFFFYTPFGRSLLVCKDYTKSFLMRFPLLYLAVWLIAFILEYVREGTYKQMKRSQQNFEFISNHDQLTGLFNREGFNNEISLAQTRVEQGEEFALLIMDADNFKAINDNFGHLKGDEVLQIISDSIRQFLKDKDGSACRWGGEEFAIFLFGESATNYAQNADDLRIFISQEVRRKEPQIKHTVSIGAVNVKMVESFDADKVFNIADKMVYKAKKNGKNQVVCY